MANLTNNTMIDEQKQREFDEWRRQNGMPLTYKPVPEPVKGPVDQGAWATDAIALLMGFSALMGAVCVILGIGDKQAHVAVIGCNCLGCAVLLLAIWRVIVLLEVIAKKGE